MKQYIHKDIESSVQLYWQKENVFLTEKQNKQLPKQFIIGMFPYPSGDGLHTGHARIFSAVDFLARFYRLMGHNVLHTIGWDAFGLPAEQAALKKKINPNELVIKNIDNFRRQMKMIGLSADFSREMSTTDPKYYGITQWIFLQLFKSGLAYKKLTSVWFCKDLGTVLSDEEVIQTEDGLRSERGNFPVEKKNLYQWTLRITEYADRLEGDLKDVEWPQGIVDMQKNWIGKSSGLEITWEVYDNDGNFLDKKLSVFTTRKDTLPGVTFIAVAPERYQEFILSDPFKKKIEEYVVTTKNKSDLVRQASKEKTGVNSGLFAKNPLNDTLVPIFFADYVLNNYGTGVVMGVPAHDERDYGFAKKFNLPIIFTTDPKGSEDTFYVKNGLQINSGEDFDGLDNIVAGEKIQDKLLKESKAVIKTYYKIRDWIFSRQRYWGEPFPLIFCEQCAERHITWWDTKNGKEYLKQVTKNFVTQEIKNNVYGWFIDENLPIELPYVESYEPSGDGTSPLSKIEGWLSVKCPHCGADARRESDTMPNWAGSCWYPLYYAIKKSDRDGVNFNNPFEKDIKEQINTWMNVDWYLGGAEHAVLHLLYSRFWIKVLYDLGYIAHNEPFYRLRSVGMVLGEDGKKMSKSLGNVVNPDDMVHEYGADALRIYEAFMAPFSNEIAWNERSIIGAHRFLQRVFNMISNNDNYVEIADKEIVKTISFYCNKVLRDMKDIKFNTCIAFLMSCMNEVELYLKKGKKLDKAIVKIFLQTLSIFAPFTSEYLWMNILKEPASIVYSKLPEILAFEDKPKTKLVVQVNGKLRCLLEIDTKDKEIIVEKALSQEQIKKFITGEIKKIVYIEGKILNIVV